MSYYINIHSNSACIYNLADFSKANINEHTWDSGQIIDNEVKGKYSKKSKKRFTSIIKNWLSVIESIEYFNKGKKKKIDSYLRFVTLTLSAKQEHEDKFIKRHMLNRFIRDIKQKHNVTNYLYCSETQGNGNIHFHILIDNFINYKDIRTIWNKIQASHGYIKRFKEKNGHDNPNSTDVRRLNKVNNVANYLVKYFTKDLNRRKIDGRLWGSSENLKELQHYVKEFSYHEAMLFNSIQAEGKKKIYSGDFFHLINNIHISELASHSDIIQEDVMEYYYCQLPYLNGGLKRLQLPEFITNLKIIYYVKRYPLHSHCVTLGLLPLPLSITLSEPSISNVPVKVPSSIVEENQLSLSFRESVKELPKHFE